MKPFLCAQFLSNPCCAHLSARPFVNGLVGGLFLGDVAVHAKSCPAIQQLFCVALPKVYVDGAVKHIHTHIYIYIIYMCVYIYNTYCIYLRIKIIMIIRVSLRWDTQNVENP